MKPIAEYDIVDHGIEHSQYFQGCGTAFTEYDVCTTGIGDTYLEAFEDAAEQLAQMDYDTATIEPDQNNSQLKEKLGDDLYYYVSIRVR